MSVLVGEGPDTGLVWHFGNPVREQRAIEVGDAFVDLGNRGIISITGPERLTWLHSLTSQHLTGLAPGDSTTALILNPQGHIEYVLNGVDDGETFWAFTEADQIEGLVGWLSRMVFMTRVEVADRTADFRLLWVGDKVEIPAAISRQSAFGVGREVFWPRETEIAVEPNAGTWALEAIRIAAGVPRIGVDTDHKTIPNEIGLLGTHLDKGCYRGQETVARVHTLGRPPRRLTQLLLDGMAEALPVAGSSIDHEGRSVGFIGSSARHHELGPIALALLKRNLPLETQLLVRSAEDEEIAASQEALVDPNVGMHVRPQVSNIRPPVR